MQRARLLTTLAGLAAATFVLGGCGLSAQTVGPVAEPSATVRTPIVQTIYTAVDFVGRHGVLAGYEQSLSGGPTTATQTVETVPRTSEILRTSDGGRTWQRTSLGNWQVLALDMVTARVGYLTAMGLDGGYAVLRTADGGRSWRRVERLPFQPTIVGVFGPAKLLVLSGGRLWSTEDGGRTWRSLRLGVPGIAAADFSSPLKGYAVAGTSILATEDGGVHWQRSYSLPRTLALQLGPATGATIDVPSGGRGWASFTLSACWPGGCPNVVLHQDLGGAWRIVSGEDAGPLGGVAASEDRFPGGALSLWATGPESAVWNGAGGLWQTADGGATWQEIGAAKAHQPSPPFVAVSGARPGDIWAVGQDQWGGYLLHDTETGWQQVRPEPFPVSAVDFVTRQVGYGIGLSWNPHAIVGTRDGGRSWRMLSPAGSGLPIALDFLSPDHGYVVTAGSGGTLFETADGGRTWQTVASFASPAAALTFRSATEGAVLLETGPGWPLQFALRETADGGATWNAGGIPRTLKDALATATPIDVTSASAVLPSPVDGYFLALVGGDPELWQLRAGNWSALSVPPGEASRGNGPEQYQGGAMAEGPKGDLWLALQPAWTGAPVRIMRRQAGAWQTYDLPLPVRLNLPAGSQAISVFGPDDAVLLTNIGPIETTDGGQSWQRP